MIRLQLARKRLQSAGKRLQLVRKRHQPARKRLQPARKRLAPARKSANSGHWEELKVRERAREMTESDTKRESERDLETCSTTYFRIVIL